ncbi:FkbM family methyltransferase [Histidinibacterium lentulum]|uniref:FkbM family methyltransferase n=1 Tax=Histidinibacterium lentulum TaxID=2480588 RepID=A0A3N2R9F3_9RHOB|nr:FkbM family methyltransferase [Histidinibacterium lentulum]ROU04110.1 FkbM family methyltransferase [Histidinibacterium lentulum]
MTEVTLPRPETTDESYFDAGAALAALEAGEPVAFPPFDLVHWGGFCWCLNYRRDPVQSALRQGRFYEEGQLAVLKRHLRGGAHVIDIGANIGNHSIWFARRAGAARVVVAEPNPLALAPLMANVLVNGLREVIDLTRIGVGLSDEAAAGLRMKRHDRNLGATRMFPEGGDLRVVRGDDLFATERPDLIKIDVEGMEMKVLSGLESIVSDHRPLLFVEVDAANEGAFADWCASRDYGAERLAATSDHGSNWLATCRRSGG